MTSSEAQAEVFWKAFTGLPRREQRGVISRMIGDANLRKDLIDLALMESRHDEPARPFRAYLAEADERNA